MLRSDKSIQWHDIMARILLRVAGERFISSEAIMHSTDDEYFGTTRVRGEHLHHRLRKTRVRGETESGTAIYIYTGLERTIMASSLHDHVFVYPDCSEPPFRLGPRPLLQLPPPLPPFHRVLFQPLTQSLLTQLRQLRHRAPSLAQLLLCASLLQDYSTIVGLGPRSCRLPC